MSIGRGNGDEHASVTRRDGFNRDLELIQARLKGDLKLFAIGEAQFLARRLDGDVHRKVGAVVDCDRKSGCLRRQRDSTGFDQLHLGSDIGNDIEDHVGEDPAGIRIEFVRHCRSENVAQRCQQPFGGGQHGGVGVEHGLGQPQPEIARGEVGAAWRSRQQLNTEHRAGVVAGWGTR